MSKYDLIAFDMDGTLLDSQKKVREDSLIMIEKAVQSGKIVTLSTGRCMPELTMFNEQFRNISYYNCISGALIWDNINQTTLTSSPIPRAIALELLEIASKEDLMIHFHSDRSIIQENMIDQMPAFQMGNSQEMFRRITVKPKDIVQYYKDNDFPLYKVCLYSRTPELREQLLPKLLPLDLTLTYSEKTSIECSRNGISKASGLLHLCQKLGIPVERTIAVGDADNDLSILKTAGLAIAMGNANQNVKSIADVTVSDNNHGGCAEAIEKYLL